MSHTTRSPLAMRPHAIQVRPYAHRHSTGTHASAAGMAMGLHLKARCRHVAGWLRALAPAGLLRAGGGIVGFQCCWTRLARARAGDGSSRASLPPCVHVCSRTIVSISIRHGSVVSRTATDAADARSRRGFWVHALCKCTLTPRAASAASRAQRLAALVCSRLLSFALVCSRLLSVALGCSRLRLGARRRPVMARGATFWRLMGAPGRTPPGGSPTVGVTDLQPGSVKQQEQSVSAEWRLALPACSPHRRIGHRGGHPDGQHQGHGADGRGGARVPARGHGRSGDGWAARHRRWQHCSHLRTRLRLRSARCEAKVSGRCKYYRREERGTTVADRGTEGSPAECTTPARVADTSWGAPHL